MAQLVDVYRIEKQPSMNPKQLPLKIDETLTMVMDLSRMGLVCESPTIKGKELEEFTKKYNILSPTEMQHAFAVEMKEISDIVDQTVPCVGCRRSAETLFRELAESGHPALDPLYITPERMLSIKQEQLESPQTLCTMLHGHRFCGECRTKVLRAYTLLVEEPDPCREKGYVPALYLGIKRCIPDKHLHLQARTSYIASLISRAEPELMGSRRERHAKTLEIAQEEVLTCLGLCVYERLHKINLRLREEEYTCQVLAAGAIEALCRKFEMAVEVKQGISQLELLYQQFTKEELAKQQKKEHKKLKKRKKKEKRTEQDEKENNCDCESEENADHNEELYSSCMCSDAKLSLQNTERHKLQVLDRKSKGSPTCYCEDCLRRKKDKGSLAGSIDDQSGKTNKMSEKQQQPQHSRKTGINCTGDATSSNNNNLVRNSTPPAPKQSLSPCQSCKSAQDLVDTSHITNCLRCNGNWSSSEHSQDCGYSSENNNGCCDTGSGSSSLPSSPEGSEVACSDGFCNHEGDCNGDRNCELQFCERSRQVNSGNVNLSKGPGGLKLTLQQMLEVGKSYSMVKLERGRIDTIYLLDVSSHRESCSSDEECYIPVEEVQEFKLKMRSVMEKRQELRQTLRKRFDELCINPPQPRIYRSAHCASN
ncbi:hypothetical protein C0J52_09229 [Blattella germanica]|nr:hypothetical protein C0J52_09229 [Blattella germanica]